MSGSFGLTTCRGRRSHSHRRYRPTNRSKDTPPHRLRRRSLADGKQVRFWLTKPKTSAAPTVRDGDRAPTSQSHQGQWPEAASKVRMYARNLFVAAITRRKLDKRRRPCTDVANHVEFSQVLGTSPNRAPNLVSDTCKPPSSKILFEPSSVRSRHADKNAWPAQHFVWPRG